MKYRQFTKLTTCVLFLGLWVMTSNAQKTYPEVTFHYSYIPFDRSCSKFTDFDIEEEWVDELYSKMDMFRELWKAQGPELLKATIERVGQSFKKSELHASMTLCKFGSMSHPFMLSMRQYLNTTTGNNPKDKQLFVVTVFHEILHIYVYDILMDKESVPLLEKYSGEPNSVRNHLHLMALIKHAYLKLGLEDALLKVIKNDAQLGPIYSRSWEIVNNIEDYNDFIDELRKQ